MKPKVSSTTSGPSQPQQALSWIKEAVLKDRYKRTEHLAERMNQRQVSFEEVLFALLHGQRAEPYPEPPRRGGTCWRIVGKDPKGRRLGIGVEAYLDDQARWTILCTVIDMNKRERR